jgi:hypothetical protein
LAVLIGVSRAQSKHSSMIFFMSWIRWAQGQLNQ